MIQIRRPGNFRPIEYSSFWSESPGKRALNKHYEQYSVFSSQYKHTKVQSIRRNA